MLPAQTGGKMFSENLAKLVFWLFLLLSVPVGFHHQFADPGIPQAWKILHSTWTMSLAFPSLLTAFTVVASLETWLTRPRRQGLPALDLPSSTGATHPTPRRTSP